MRQGESWVTNGSTFGRASRFLTTTFPCTSTPWTHTTFFARSIPSVVTCAMVDPPIVGHGFYAHNHRDLDAMTCPVGGSIPLVCRRAKMVAMGTRRPRSGLRLCRRWALQWRENG